MSISVFPDEADIEFNVLGGDIIINSPEIIHSIRNFSKTNLIQCISKSSDCSMFSLRYEEPNYDVDETILVKEPWQCCFEPNSKRMQYFRASDFALNYVNKIKWHSAENMPDELNNLYLYINSVIIKRIQDLTEEEIMHINEMFMRMYISDSKYLIKSKFAEYWDNNIVAGKNTYDIYNKNPWVWIYSFKFIQD